MDIHLDILLDLPNVTVFTCEQVEGFTVLKLKLLNDGMNCPHCHTYTDEVHQNRGKNTQSFSRGMENIA